jgi:hypothetical protein
MKERERERKKKKKNYGAVGACGFFFIVLLQHTRIYTSIIKFKFYNYERVRQLVGLRKER